MSLTLKVVLLDLSFRGVPRQFHESLLLLLRLLAPTSPPLERQSDAFLLRRIPRISRISQDKDIGLIAYDTRTESQQCNGVEGTVPSALGPLERQRRGHFSFEVRNNESDLAAGLWTR